MPDWVVLSNVATGAGTLVLAIATFASVRSANRSARIAEHTLSASLRPLLVPSRLEDRGEKVFWSDGYHALLSGGQVVADCVDGNVYLAMSVRNIGPGLGVLQGWFLEERDPTIPQEHRAIEAFRTQGRDLYVPPGDLGFWQAGLRDRDDPNYVLAYRCITRRQPFLVDVLYSDHEGGQRAITRFSALPAGDDGRWLATVGRHWFLDRAGPR